MRKQSKIFTKGDCELLHGILSGTAAKTDGVKIQRFTNKIQAELLKTHNVYMEKPSIRQVLYWKTNNQIFWRAAYAVCEAERPGLFEELKGEQKSEKVPAMETELVA